MKGDKHERQGSGSRAPIQSHMKRDRHKHKGRQMQRETNMKGDKHGQREGSGSRTPIQSHMRREKYKTEAKGDT